MTGVLLVMQTHQQKRELKMATGIENVLLLLVCTVVYVAGTCPLQCICNIDNGLVSCSGIVNTKWSKFLKDLPIDVKVLEIEWSIFKEKLPHNHEDEFVAVKSESVPLSSLSTLKIRNSTLINLPGDAFNSLVSLKELRMNYMTFVNTTLLMLSTLNEVEVVDLSHNHIEDIPEELLLAWSSIQDLNLQHNDISEFSLIVFEQLLTLEFLDLSHNDISFIHPLSFINGTSLSRLDLRGNNLKNLHPQLVHNTSHAAIIHLGNNPWDCHCGMLWLKQALLDNSTELKITDPSQIICQSPEHLKSQPIVSLNYGSFDCEPPQIIEAPESDQLQYMHKRILQCNATGYPSPSVYWITPRGEVIHKDHRHWAPHEVAMDPDHLVFSGEPSFFHAAVRTQSDGSLLIEDFRYYFEGEYTCVAVNPAGSVSHSLNVTIFVIIPEAVKWSMFWGGVTAAGFLLIGVIFGAIFLGARRVCCPGAFKPDLFLTEDDDVIYDDCSTCSSEDYEYDRSPFWSLQPSPRRSPRKCVTPSEAHDTDHKHMMSGNIKETLETVRIRLRQNMEKQVNKIRSQAQNMKKNRHKYMKTMKHRTGHYMKNIKKTSNQYVHKMREGVVVGVEAVKYHVQSMKELCGTGDIMHTVSTISISTNVDSNQQSKVVKTVTFV